MSFVLFQELKVGNFRKQISQVKPTTTTTHVIGLHTNIYLYKVIGNWRAK